MGIQLVTPDRGLPSRNSTTCLRRIGTGAMGTVGQGHDADNDARSDLDVDE
jgi:hypothetical protein